MSAVALSPDALLAPDPRTLPDADRLRAFGEAIDAVRKRVEADLGEADVAYIRRVDDFSRGMEAVGRVLIHVSFEPIGWSLGVAALWIHKQLQATEVGHTVLHGAFDRLPGAERFHSKRWWWDVPIDERAWHQGHNLRHHQFTNVAGKDPDIHFGPVRLTEHTPHRIDNYWQVPYSILFLWPNFGWTMNMHFSGLTDVYLGNGRADRHDFIPDRSWATLWQAHRTAFRKYLPYAAKEYVFYPALAGPFFLKVVAGNWLSSRMRDVYTAATIYCGHVGEDIARYPEGSRARGKGQWYAMQVESSQNFEVSLRVSQLCGTLDRQIEHHLFPHFPTNRLREVAPEIRAICEAHGVRYRTGTWGSVLRKVFGRLWTLSFKSADDAVPEGLHAPA